LILAPPPSPGKPERTTVRGGDQNMAETGSKQRAGGGRRLAGRPGSSPTSAGRALLPRLPPTSPTSSAPPPATRSGGEGLRVCQLDLCRIPQPPRSRLSPLQLSSRSDARGHRRRDPLRDTAGQPVISRFGCDHNRERCPGLAFARESSWARWTEFMPVSLPSMTIFARSTPTGTKPPCTHDHHWRY
jgi:hypothetical protein